MSPDGMNRLSSIEINKLPLVYLVNQARERGVRVLLRRRSAGIGCRAPFWFPLSLLRSRCLLVNVFLEIGGLLNFCPSTIFTCEFLFGPFVIVFSFVFWITLT